MFREEGMRVVGDRAFSYISGRYCKNVGSNFMSISFRFKALVVILQAKATGEGSVSKSYISFL